MFYLNSTLSFGIPPVLVFQLEVYWKVDRILTSGLTQGLIKGAILCCRNPYFYFQYGESTSTASQLTSPASQKSKDLNKVLLLLQDLAHTPNQSRDAVTSKKVKQSPLCYSCLPLPCLTSLLPVPISVSGQNQWNICWALTRRR